jgi:hypothetical protein
VVFQITKGRYPKFFRKLSLRESHSFNDEVRFLRPYLCNDVAAVQLSYI